MSAVSADLAARVLPDKYQVTQGEYPTKAFLKLLLTVAAGILPLQVVAAPLAPAVSSRVAEIIASRCALCHGPEGESASAIYPRLAAQHPDYIVKQLKDFRDGRRKGETMTDMAKDLQDTDIAGLAAFFSSRKAGGRQSGDVDLAGVGKYIFHRGNNFSGVAACASCHGPKGFGTELLPRLAGQHPAYIEIQLKEFNKRERTNDNSIMHSIASKLTELETKAVSVYIGGLQ
ncbi:MAG: c-type cytochrome [Sulfuritalea sp.]|nr:c-type cytochrome [Sulfuritalea sp.]